LLGIFWNWNDFHWDSEKVAILLDEVCRGQGRLFGRLSGLSFDGQLKMMEENLVHDIIHSSEINRDKKLYYDILERTQRGDGDITEWIVWYLQTLLSALRNADMAVNSVLNKSLFWMKAASIPMSERQTQTLNKFLDGYEAKITTKNWAAINKCSPDTANRDIQDLVTKGILREDVPGAKRPSYSIVNSQVHDDLTTIFKDISVTSDETGCYLNAVYKDTMKVRERILKLDAERYASGDLPTEHLLSKYCSYLVAGL